MTEEQALAMSTGWFNPPHPEIGYLPFSAANFLVGTGRYEFAQVSCWGYVVRPVYCPGCGAPRGYPPAGPCQHHGTAEAAAR